MRVAALQLTFLPRISESLSAPFQHPTIRIQQIHPIVSIMSFGYGIGDVIAVGELAWKLHHDCYLVARGAPQEFKLLVDELKTLHMSMKMFEEELQNNDSILSRSGNDRKKMIADMVGQVRTILDSLLVVFAKHRNIGNTSRPRVKRGWDQFKWSLNAKEVDSLRNKVRP